MNNVINFSEMKNDTMRKKETRKFCNNQIYEKMKDVFGEENVLIVPYEIETENGISFSSGTVICCVGQTKNNEGYDVDVIVEISAKVKSWNNTGTKRLIKAVNYDDVLEAIELNKPEAKD